LVFVGQSPEWSDALPTLMMRKQVVGIPRRTQSGLVPETLSTNQRVHTLFASQDKTIAYVDLIDLFAMKRGA